MAESQELVVVFPNAPTAGVPDAGGVDVFLLVVVPFATFFFGVIIAWAIADKSGDEGMMVAWNRLWKNLLKGLPPALLIVGASLSVLNSALESANPVQTLTVYFLTLAAIMEQGVVAEVIFEARRKKRLKDVNNGETPLVPGEQGG